MPYRARRRNRCTPPRRAARLAFPGGDGLARIIPLGLPRGDGAEIRRDLQNSCLRARPRRSGTCISEMDAILRSHRRIGEIPLHESATLVLIVTFEGVQAILVGGQGGRLGIRGPSAGARRRRMRLPRRALPWWRGAPAGPWTRDGGLSGWRRCGRGGGPRAPDPTSTCRPTGSVRGPMVGLAKVRYRNWYSPPPIVSGALHSRVLEPAWVRVATLRALSFSAVTVTASVRAFTWLASRWLAMTPLKANVPTKARMMNTTRPIMVSSKPKLESKTSRADCCLTFSSRPPLESLIPSCPLSRFRASGPSTAHQKLFRL